MLCPCIEACAPESILCPRPDPPKETIRYQSHKTRAFDYLKRRGTSVPRMIMNDSGESVDVPAHNFEVHMTMLLPSICKYYMPMLLRQA